MSLVSLTRIEGNNTKKAIADSLELLSYAFPRGLRSVVFKINACYYWDYSTGQTTDPAFVASIIELIRETSPNADIALIESDASAMKCKYVFRFLGYEKLSKSHKVRLVNLSEVESDDVSVSCANQSYNFQVPKIIRDADLRINIPKIKYTMKGIELTCALKNIFGCNPYPLKFKHHPQLGKVIVALNKAMKFDLCIIDGNIVSGIQPRKIGLVLASKDPVAADAAAARIAGISPNSIGYLKLAHREGLGSMDFIEKGELLNEFRSLYPKKTLSKKLMGVAVDLVVRLGLGKRLGLE